MRGRSLFFMKNQDPLLKSFKKVTADWDVVEFVLCVVFLPLSLLYIALRMAQEYED